MCRILQHTGFYPSFDAESAAMAAGRANVQNRTLVLTDWWDSGIVHAKVWIANKKDAYIGSANNDWKSLTQVNIIDTTFLGGELVKAHLAKTRVLSRNWLKLCPCVFPAYFRVLSYLSWFFLGVEVEVLVHMTLKKHQFS